MSYSNFQCFHPSSSVSFLAPVPGENTALTGLHMGNPGFQATCVREAFLPAILSHCSRVPFSAFADFRHSTEKERLHLQGQWREK